MSWPGSDGDYRNLERTLDTGDPAVLVRYLASWTRRGLPLQDALVKAARHVLNARRPKGAIGQRITSDIGHSWRGIVHRDLDVQVSLGDRATQDFLVSFERDQLTDDMLVRLRPVSIDGRHPESPPSLYPVDPPRTIPDRS